MRLRFDAEQHHTLDLGDYGTPSVIHGGQASTVDDEFAQTLIEADWVNVTVIPSGAAVWPKSHAKLDELAETLGYAWPETENDTALTVKEKVAALEEAGYTPHSVYKPADDQHDTPDDEAGVEGDEGDITDQKESTE